MYGTPEPLSQETHNDAIAAALEPIMDSAGVDLDKHLLIGGHIARMRITGTSLAGCVYRSLSHLECSSRGNKHPPKISIYLSETHGIPKPKLFQDVDPTLSRTWTGYDLSIRCSPNGRLVSWRFGKNSSLLLDRETLNIVGMLDPREFGLFERTKPLLLLLRVCLHDLDAQIMHAGLVSEDDKGVLIAGPEKSGKSSTALECFFSGFHFLGDDQVAVTPTEGHFRGHSLYNAALIEPRGLSHFGSLPESAFDRDAGEEKTAIFLAELFPERIKKSVTIHAIVLPRISSIEKVRFFPAKKGEALRRIAPSSLLLPLGSGGKGFRYLNHLVSRTPSYWLEIGQRRSEIPGNIRRLLSISGL